ncbi:hypothetical protein BCR42DRAFT_420050 [Absidia repens]|uniref:F-box domain-containing protein n=1 Tax=Absidia repens TaxID=90262 RepID=A0A1X2IAM0_9FUNG|nr:hypothetical protein BCR42DRAFT_420050 [Absidia repens]
MILAELPQELILEIYHCLYDDLSNVVLEGNGAIRQLWLLNVLSTCMVCQSWYSAGFEYMSIRFSSSSLSLTTILCSVECGASFPPVAEPTWPRLLADSKKNKLDFHQYVRRLVVNLSGVFNTSTQQYELKRNELNIRLEQTIDIEHFLESVKMILVTCPNIKTLEILYDCHYIPTIENRKPCQLLDLLSNSISDALTIHEFQHHHGFTQSTTSTSRPSTCLFLSHLVLTSREPQQRCPCCAGRGWDYILIPLLRQLPVTTLELDHVLPSRPVLECLAQSRRVHTLVIRGNLLVQASRLARYGASISTPPRIPLDLLSQLHTLEIYLYSNHDGEEDQDSNSGPDTLDLLAMFRQTYDIVHPIKSLQRLILHGHEPYNLSLFSAPSATIDGSSLIDNDVWKKLELLAGRHHLKSFVLENIPGFRCPSVQSKLQNMFTSVEKVNVVYST